MGLIFGASSIPGPHLPELARWDALAKKLGHMIGYALLAAAYYHALCGAEPFSWTRRIVPMGLALLYAFSDEWHQAFVPGRNASLLDVGIDAAGSIIGLAVWFRLRKRLPWALQVRGSHPRRS